jgi:hypothetical protein
VRQDAGHLRCLRAILFNRPQTGIALLSHACHRALGEGRPRGAAASACRDSASCRIIGRSVETCLDQSWRSCACWILKLTCPITVLRRDVSEPCLLTSASRTRRGNNKLVLKAVCRSVGKRAAFAQTTALVAGGTGGWSVTTTNSPTELHAGRS